MRSGIRAVGLFLDPWPAPVRSRPASRAALAARFRRAVYLKANPRTEGYMRELFADHWPGGNFVTVDGGGKWTAALEGAGYVVLLYPDAVGIGFEKVERALQKMEGLHRAVMVLNGRRREFVLDEPRLRGLRLRRFLERTMAGEFAALVVFAAATPLLLAADLLRGRR